MVLLYGCVSDTRPPQARLFKGEAAQQRVEADEALPEWSFGALVLVLGGQSLGPCAARVATESRHDAPV